jgi:alanyl-tRNA synthetase
VENTGKLYPFRIVSEGSIATGIRRIEATAGLATVDFLMNSYSSLEAVGNTLKVRPAEVEALVKKLVEEQAEQNRRLNMLSTLLANTSQLPNEEKTVVGLYHLENLQVTVVVHELSGDHWEEDFLLKRINFLKVCFSVCFFDPNVSLYFFSFEPLHIAATKSTRDSCPDLRKEAVVWHPRQMQY